MPNKDIGWMWTKIKSALSGKVDKVHGKGLSTNDFTDEDKNKLDAVSAMTEAEIDTLFQKEDAYEDH